METAKCYPSSSNSQMLGMKIHGVVKSPVRKSKVKWRHVICTRRDQRDYPARLRCDNLLVSQARNISIRHPLYNLGLMVFQYQITYPISIEQHDTTYIQVVLTWVTYKR